MMIGIIGTGGHAKVILDIFQNSNRKQLFEFLRHPDLTSIRFFMPMPFTKINKISYCKAILVLKMACCYRESTGEKE